MTVLEFITVDPFLAFINKLIEPPWVILKEAVGPSGKYPLIFPDVFSQVMVVEPVHETLIITPPVET